MSKKFYTWFACCLLALLTALPLSVNANELTVNADASGGTSNVPVYGSYVDTENTHTQVLYLASEIEGITAGSTINAMTFYISSSAAAEWGAGLSVKLGETDQTDLATSYATLTGETEVYSGTGLSGTGSTMAIQFTTPYQYQGGNLVVDIVVTEGGSWKSATFVARSASPAMGRYNSGYGAGTANNYQPKVLIDYTPSSTPVCFRPKNLAISNITATSATATWTAGGTEAAWDISIDNGATRTSLSNTTRTFSNLTPNTEYTVILRAKCSDNEYSGEVSTTFKTECNAIESSALPWTEDFESYDGTTYSANGVIPDCWGAAADGTILPHVIGSGSYWYKHSGTKSLSFKGNGNCYAVLPAFEPALNTLQISFWYQYESASSGTLSLGYIKANDVNFNTFTLIENVPAKASSMAYYEKMLQTLPADAYKLVLRWYYNGGYACCVDDVNVKFLPTCIKPESVGVKDITTSSATLFWGEESTGDYLLSVKKDSIYLVGSAQSGAAVTGESYLLSNLETATSYSLTVTVVKVCSATDRSDSITNAVSFSTRCDAISELPYVESFENSSSSSLPTVCWTRVESYESYGTNYPYVGTTSSSAYQGGKYLYFYGGASTSEQIVALPEISADLSNARIRFWYKNGTTGTSYPSIILGKMSNVDDEESFVAIETLEQKSSYTAYEKELTTVGSDYHYLAFKLAGGTSATSAYIDSIIIDAIPSCYPVVSLGISEEVGADPITANSVLIEWAGHQGQNSSYLVTVKNGEEFISYNGEAYDNKLVNGNSLRIRGLESTKSYDLTVSIVAACAENDHSEVFTDHIVFNTLCEKISALPWKEGFDSITAGIPICWDNSEGTTTTASYKWSSYATGHQGRGLRFNSYSNDDGNTNILKSPEIDLPAEAAQLVFWCKNPTGGDFSVSVCANGGTPQVVLSDLTSISDWTEKEVDLSAYVGQTIQIYFTGTSNWGSGDAYLYLDDVTVRAIPTCFSASNLRAVDSLATTSSVSFAWSPNGDETSWRVVVKDGETELANQVVNDTVYNLTGLEPSKNYTFAVSVYVQCGDIESYPVEGTFECATACAAVSNLPMTFDFEDITGGSYALPICWSRLDGSNYPYVYNSSTYALSGSRLLYFYGGGSTTPRYVMMPEMAADLSSLMITLNYYHGSSYTGSAYGSLTIGVMSNPADTSTFVAIQTLDKVSRYSEVEVQLTGAPADCHYIAIRYAGGTSTGYAYVDDIDIRPIPACHKPSEAKAGRVTASSATFSWEGNASSYAVKIYNDTVYLDSIVVNTPSLSIDTLQANTDYEFTLMVQGLCGAEDGASVVRTTTISLHTPCEVLTTWPFAENFNSLTSGIPNCWDNSVGTTTTASYLWGYYATGKSGACVRFNSYSNSRGNTNILTTPVITLPAQVAQLVFWFKNPTGGDFNVSIVDEQGEEHVLLTDLTGVSEWTEAKVFLTPYAGQTVQIRFNATSNYGSGDAYMYIDDVELSDAPNCRQLSALEVLSVAQNSAELAWIPGGDEELWGVQLYQDTTLVQYSQVSDTSIVFNGLSTKTSYSVNVYALCSSNDSSEVVTASLRTLGEVTALPYSSDFEDDADNAKWSPVYSASYSPSKWTIGSATNNGGSKAMYVSSDNGSSYLYNSGAGCASIIYRTFHFDAGDYIMSFDWKGVGESSYDGMSILFIPATANVDDAVFALSGSYDEGTATVDGVVISRNAPTLTAAAAKGWLPLTRGTATYSWFNQASDWQSNQTFEHSFDTPADYHLVFFWTNDKSSGTNPPAAIDNLSIAKKLCGDITSIHDAQPTTTGATLSWAAVDDAISYDYVVLPRGEEFSDESMASVSDTIVQISGLAHSSFYDFYLRAVCTEGAGRWESAAFHTECEMLMSTEVYNEDDEMIFGFEEYAANKNLQDDILCWQTEGGVWKTTTTAHSGSVGAYVAALGATDTFSLLITPAFELIEEQELVAYVKEGVSHSDADSVVFYINDAPALEGATRIGAVAAIADWREFRGKLPEGWFTEDEIAEVEQAYILIQAYAEKAIYVDDIMLHYAPNCATVKNVELAVEATSLTVTWEAGGNETSWAVSYAVKGAEKSWEGLVNNNPILVINDLPANTADTLTVEIVSLCEDDAMSEAVQSVFAYKTLCAISEFPWTENFDALTAGIPECWDNSEGTTTYDTYKWKYYATGHNGACVRFDSYSNSSNNTNILATPMIQLPANPVQLGFYCMNPKGGNYSVSISVAGGEPQVVLNNLTNISAWTEKEVDLTAYAGQTIQIFFNATSNYGSGDAYLYLDDVTITPITSCKPAKDAGVKNITMNSATLYWSPATTAGDYRVTVKDGEEILVDNQLVQDTFLVISNLTPSTAYTLEASITTDCGNGEVSYPYVAELAFATKCEPIAITKQQPWAEDFEDYTGASYSSNGVIPDCWDAYSTSSVRPHVIPSSDTYGYVHSGTKALTFYGSGNNYAILPAFEAELNTLQISFWYATESDSYGTLTLGYITAEDVNCSTFTAIQQYPASSASYHTMVSAEVSLNELPASASRLVFRWYYSSQYSCTIDDVEVIPQPTCFKPSDVALVEYTTNSASFTWEGNADNYSVKIYNGTNLIADTLIAASELPFEIDTLQANTSYPFRFVVKGICSEDDESAENSSVVSVHTLCEALVIDDENWWVEDFNSLTQQNTIPDCWSNEEGTTTSSSYKWGAVGTGAVGSAYLRFNSYNNADGNTNVLATPMLTLPETPAQLVFLCKNPAGGDFNVAIAGEDGVRDTVLSNLTGIADWTEQKIMLADYAGQAIRIFFNATSNYGTSAGNCYIDLDSVAINAAPNCMPVKNIEKFSLTANEVVFTWDQNGSEAQWDVVVTDNLNAQAQPLFNATVDSRSISIAIEPNTKYSMHVSVAAHCEGEGNISEAVAEDFIFRSPLSEDMVREIENNTVDSIDLSDPDEQAKWTLLGADETNHFIFASFNENAGLYISNDDASWQYTTMEAPSAAIAYRAFSVPEDNTPVEISFKWQANGQSTVDYGRAFIAGADVEMEIANHQAKFNGTQMTAYNAISGVYSLSNGVSPTLSGATAEQSLTDDDYTLDAGQYYIVFAWRNNDDAGAQNPLGIYDLKIWNKKGYTPTAVGNIAGEGVEVQKILQDGQVYILRDGVIYNILGTIVR